MTFLFFYVSNSTVTNDLAAVFLHLEQYKVDVLSTIFSTMILKSGTLQRESTYVKTS